MPAQMQWLCATSMGPSQVRSEIAAHAQQIREHTGRRDFGTCAGTLHDERVAVVARGGVTHHVVGQRDVGEGMRFLELGYAHRGLAIGGKPAHVAQDLAARRRFVEALPHLAVVFRDRKSTRLNSSHSQISYAVFCLKKKNK